MATLRTQSKQVGTPLEIAAQIRRLATPAVIQPTYTFDVSDLHWYAFDGVDTYEAINNGQYYNPFGKANSHIDVDAPSKTGNVVYHGIGVETGYSIPSDASQARWNSMVGVKYVKWASDNVGTNNYAITANGDGSIVAEQGLKIDSVSGTITSLYPIVFDVSYGVLGAAAVYPKTIIGNYGAHMYVAGGGGSLAAGSAIIQGGLGISHGQQGGDTIIKGGRNMYDDAPSGNVFIGSSDTSAFYIGSAAMQNVSTGYVLYYDLEDGRVSYHAPAPAYRWSMTYPSTGANVESGDVVNFNDSSTVHVRGSKASNQIQLSFDVSNANIFAAFSSPVTAYTVLSSDNNNVIDASGTFTITFPKTLPVGFATTIVNIGPGVITLNASTLLATDSSVALRDRYAMATVVHKGSGRFYAAGNLK